MNALLSVPSPPFFISPLAPLGPAVRLCDIFIRRTAVTPTSRLDIVCTLGFDLVLSNFVSEELPGEECSQAVLLQSPVAPPHFLVSSISGHTHTHTSLQSKATRSFYAFVLLTLIIAAFAALSHMLLLISRAALLRE